MGDLYQIWSWRENLQYQIFIKIGALKYVSKIYRQDIVQDLLHPQPLSIFNVLK